MESANISRFELSETDNSRTFPSGDKYNFNACGSSLSTSTSKNLFLKKGIFDINDL